MNQQYNKHCTNLHFMLRTNEEFLKTFMIDNDFKYHHRPIYGDWRRQIE